MHHEYEFVRWQIPEITEIQTIQAAELQRSLGTEIQLIETATTNSNMHAIDGLLEIEIIETELEKTEQMRRHRFRDAVTGVSFSLESNW